MIKNYTVLAIFFIGILFCSCNKTDLTASYIYIDTTAFSIDMSNFNDEFGTGYDQGELACIADHKFPDAWVMVNGKDLGTWELPCKIPVLASDNATVQIFPGVKMNGVSTSRPRYPFTDANKQTVNLKQSGITTISDIPVKYYSTTAFKVIENFERDYNGYFTAEDSNGVNFEHIYDTENPSNRIGRISLEDTVMDFNVLTSTLNSATTSNMSF